MLLMNNLMLVLILSSIFVVTLLSFPSPAEAVYLYHFCPNTTTFTPNSTFQSNLNRLLSTLSSNATRPSGFYSASSSSSNDAVYGLFLCRGDLAATDACKTCVSTATSEAVQHCPTEKQVVIWYDECMLRYSNESFFSTVAESPYVYMSNTQNATEPTRFNQVLATAMYEVATEAANDAKKFATSQKNVSGLVSIYSLWQCTQDLSAADCNGCLRGAIALFPRCCNGKIGGRVFNPSCYVGYEVYPYFYQDSTSVPQPSPGALSPPPPPPPAAPLPKGKSKHSSINIIVASVVSALLVVLVALGYCFLHRRSRHKYDAALRQENAANDDIKINTESLEFDLVTILTATSVFSQDNKLGEGGFGEVFKGTLGNGQDIAVKRLSKSSGQGAKEFKNEVILVAKLQHRNLVRLLGFCLEGKETILVYEYVPNKSLDYFLFDPKKGEKLDWLRRSVIIGGIARGILYLHEDSRLRVIHRDLKASNILLDDNMNSKISDFGMAKMLGVDDQTYGNTTRVVGTYGYMAPEYAMEGLYSTKSDVFSFGVLLLEILTGRRNFLGFHLTNCPPTLVAYAWQLWNEGKGLELMDPLLKDSCSPNEFLRCVHIGLLCVQEDASKRPTMSSVVLTLTTETISLSKPKRPGFFTGSCIDHRDQTGALSCSANGLTLSLDMPR